MSRCQGPTAGERASSLYLAASHLYSRKGNVFEHGDDGPTRYGWATLRASALQGLSSQPSDKAVAEAGKCFNGSIDTQYFAAGIFYPFASVIDNNNDFVMVILPRSILATELLIALLSEISPNQVGDSLLLGQMQHDEDLSVDNHSSFDYDDTETTDRNHKHLPDDSYHGNDGGSSAIRSKQVSVSKPLASMAKTPFFAQAPPSALSLSQSKWLEDEPIPHIQLPFVNAVSSKLAQEVSAADRTFLERASALTSSVSSMSCVTSKINFSQCAKVQNICMNNITELREKMAASSENAMGAFGVYDEGYSDESTLPSPLVVTSAKIIKAESVSHTMINRNDFL